MEKKTTGTASRITNAIFRPHASDPGTATLKPLQPAKPKTLQLKTPKIRKPQQPESGRLDP